jgi:hypothetical protein
MPRYLSLFKYNAEGRKGLMKEKAAAREAASMPGKSEGSVGPAQRGLASAALLARLGLGSGR